MAGKVVDLPGELDEVLPDGRVHKGAELGRALHLLAQSSARPVALTQLGQPVQLDLWQPECLTQVTDRAPDPVARDRGDERRPVRSPALVYPLDQLLPDVTGKVQIDVWKAVHLLVEETAEKQPVADGVDVRETDQVADEASDTLPSASSWRQVGLCTRSASTHLLGNLPCEVEHVLVHEKEAGQTMLANQPQLFAESRVGFRALLRRVAFGELTTAALRQPRVGRVSGGDRWLWQAVAEILSEVERARLGDEQRVCDRVGELQKAADLQLWCPQVEFTIGASQLVALLQGRAILDRHERVLQPVARVVVIVDVPGGDDLDTHLPGQSSQCPIPDSVAMDEVVLEFHEYALSPKPVDPAPESDLGFCDPAFRSLRGHLPLTAAREADQAGTVPGQPGQRQAGV